MNHRPLRVASLIQMELNKLIQREVELPLGTLATITVVEVDKKMEHAKVRVSILPSSNADKALQILHIAQGNLQHELMKKMNIKPLPRIQFVLDQGYAEAAKVEKLLIESEDK